MKVKATYLLNKENKVHGLFHSDIFGGLFSPMDHYTNYF